MAEDGFKLFGFEIKRAKNEDPAKAPSIVPARDEDGAGYITASGSHYGQYINLDGNQAKDNHELIMKYRGVAMHPEVDAAIEDIVNEAITGGEAPVNLNMDNHHLVVEENNLAAGIKDIRPIDSARIRKVKEVKKKKDPKSGANVIKKVDEYFIYQEKPGYQGGSGVKLSLDSVNYITSGLLDEKRQKVLSYLHKALKPINQLRMMEDSLVIYRLARAPERRIFYIDVGNLPRSKAEQYMKDIMTRYRNKLVYDQSTGEIKDDRKHQSLLEDFWLPRREGGRGTEITTLPGGENLGQIEDIFYFQKKVYRALNVPLNRLEQEQQYSLGRATEINRDEIKFQKYIDRLRTRFSYLFLGILKVQLVLKGIITEDDWNGMRNHIIVDFARDNYFTQLKESEILRERIQTLDMVSGYVGEYFSKEWVMQNVLHFSQDEADRMEKDAADDEPFDKENPQPEQDPNDDLKTGDDNE